MGDVFISYVREDAGIAHEIAFGLEISGYSTWHYERDSDPGPSYLDQIDEAIEQCKAIILILSPDSLNSPQVDIEVIRAHESGKHFIPLMRNITHEDFQKSRRGWRMALGAATSIPIPLEGVSPILPNILRGLKKLDVLPSGKSHVEQLGAIPEPEGPPVPNERSKDRQRLKPNWSPVYAADFGNQGIEFYDQGAYEQAIECFTQAIQLSTGTGASYHYERALAYYQLGDYQQAIADYSTAIDSTEPGAKWQWDGPVYNRGLTYFTIGKYDEAIEDFGKVLQLDGHQIEAHYCRGLAYEKKGEHELAEVDFYEANRLKADRDRMSRWPD